MDATAALLGSWSDAGWRHFEDPEIASEAITCTAAFALRASAIPPNIRKRGTTRRIYDNRYRCK